jgi:hypothetical protein
VQVFDAATLPLTGEVRLGHHPTVESSFTRDGSTAYASQMKTDWVYEIDRPTHRGAQADVNPAGSGAK